MSEYDRWKLQAPDYDAGEVQCKACGWIGKEGYHYDMDDRYVPCCVKCGSEDVERIEHHQEN